LVNAARAEAFAAAPVSVLGVRLALVAAVPDGAAGTDAALPALVRGATPRAVAGEAVDRGWPDALVNPATWAAPVDRDAEADTETDAATEAEELVGDGTATGTELLPPQADSARPATRTPAMGSATGRLQVGTAEL
jgi:hypothetical protein